MTSEMSDVKVDTRSLLAKIPAKVFWTLLIGVVLVAGIVSYAGGSKPSDSERTKSITKKLRCLECEGLSIYDSDTKTSKTIAKDVEQRVKAGESTSEINSYYVDIYGEFILLAPTAKSGNWLIYLVPIFFVAVLLMAIFLSVRKNISWKLQAGLWAVAGLVFITGIIVFVNDAKSTEKKAVTQQEKSTQELLQQAVDESPNNGNYRSLAIVQFAKEDYVNALKNFDKAAELNEQDAQSRGYAAYIVSLTGQYEIALDRANQAVAAKSDDVTALFFRGLIYYQISVNATSAQQQDPSGQTSTNQHKSADTTSTKQHNLELANADFDQVLKLAPQSEFASQINDLRTPN